VQQAVADDGRQDRIVEDLSPVLEILVAGHDQSGAFITAAHQAEEQSGFGIRKG